jgi:hypothetical protein
MGWTVLYIAFGIVALWLLGEVLLQYKARLRWRLLAFVGFLGVVAGVLMSSVVVIGLGAAAFAVGQTWVTLSFRRGFSADWALAVSDLESASADAGYREERSYGIYGGDSSGYPAGDPSYANAAQSQEQYAAYSDPYIGTQTYGGGYDASYGQYGQQGYTQDQYGTGTYGTGTYGTETPSGEVWVPQQRTDETYGGELPQEQQYPYQGDGQGQSQGHGNGNGYAEQQYRY